ncbi:MAG: hypothetical protein ABI690_17010 [Chloroflexota bacterium]
MRASTPGDITGKPSRCPSAANLEGDAPQSATAVSSDDANAYRKSAKNSPVVIVAK